MTRIGLLVVACFGLAGVWAAGQERATFSSSTDLVVLHVTVTDRRGGFVGGLTEESFEIFEDGYPQDISFFREQDAPVTVGLIVDHSGSMAKNRERVAAAVTAFAETSHPQDEFFAMAFNEFVQRLLPPDMRFTSSPSVIRDVLTTGIGAWGRTALYDALAAALDEVKQGHLERQVIVAVSDGGDNASRATFDETLKKAQISNAVIYTVALVDPLVTDQNPKLLRRFAEATGGRFFEPRGIERVPEALRQVNVDIRSSYTLAYAPTNTVRDDRLRLIRVLVTGPDRVRLNARTRVGYVAPPTAPSEGEGEP